MHRVLLFPVILLMVLLAGCSAPKTLALRQSPAAAEAGRVDLADVPFFAQQDHQCGPAALATLLNHTGLRTTPAEIAAEVFIPARQGSIPVEMAASARRHGRLVYPLAGELTAVLAALHQGYPVLVLQNNGLSFLPVWHYAVVVGADRDREVFWLRSGRERRLELPFATFERTWARAGYWGVLVLDPARLPDSLDPRTVIRELSLMERSGAVAEAQAGFNRALLNWPEQKTAWLGLANTSQRLGEMERAETVLRELVRRAPQYGAGLNNLADLLLKTGRPLEALPLAERAVAVLDIPATRGTLAAAQAALQPLQAEALPAQPGDLDPAVVRAEAAKAAPAKSTRKPARARKRAKAPVPATSSTP
ncbi:MAG TPA: PA2778 family cysteine peptidase [Moraxellaceae bacterium]|nr:PA2778 family cysteine peptidase [Moraxellaceae bacterium]